MPTTKTKITKVKPVKVKPVKVRKKVMKVYDFHDLTKEVERRAGKSVRDWAGRWDKKYGTKAFEATPYQDFWHFICDNFEIHNGATEWMDFDELLKDCDEDWQKEVCQLYIDVAGHGEHEVLHAW
jgi:hypothetical protein